MRKSRRILIRERTSAGLQAARERGKKGGRPRSLGLKKIAAAKAMLNDPAIRVEEIARLARIACVLRGRMRVQLHRLPGPD